MTSNETSKELGRRVAAEAVNELHEAVKEKSTNTAVARKIEAGRQAVVKRWKRGDMRLSEFTATAKAVGISPSRVLYRALRKESAGLKKKSPKGSASGIED